MISRWPRPWAPFLALALMGALPSVLLAHGVSVGDKGYIQETFGVRLVPFLYLGAKHMVTGYDHILFLCGVIFYLYRVRDIATYVTLFAVGHSSTLILGVLTKISASPFLIDAIIGFSVAYKALDNVGAFQRWFGVQPNPRAATLVFGLFHGFGLATKLLDFEMDPEGLVQNLLAFNVGVEVGQLLALSLVLIAMSYWRRSPSFLRGGFAANMLLLVAGLLLVGYQLTGYFTTQT
ncbi:MAG: HupE/UreJ family protein [Gemmatimonas sp.]|nr:HupE/UreJ family protein [Gemmatimonas sp.]MCZ8204318.1 HupE/UreJ family protein [Gemmatimonas sp.]